MNDLTSYLDNMKGGGTSKRLGMIKRNSANVTITEAMQRPNPAELWGQLWFEDEVCCLFADTNVGKSIYAVQIAAAISQTRKVLYFDFELSDKQFQMRYTTADGKVYRFPDNFERAEIDPDSFAFDDAGDDGSFEDSIIRDIESHVADSGAKVIIIDNLSYLIMSAEKGEAANRLMKKIIALKWKYSLSILVLSHTPKRDLSSPITQNTLAGSKTQMNFFNSSFAIGVSVKDAKIRYIKQIKVRNCDFTFDSDNVMLCTISKTDDGFLHFDKIGYSTEGEHLKQPSENDAAAMAERVAELVAAGKSYREIANELGISPAKVCRINKKAKS